MELSVSALNHSSRYTPKLQFCRNQRLDRRKRTLPRYHGIASNNMWSLFLNIRHSQLSPWFHSYFLWPFIFCILVNFPREAFPLWWGGVYVTKTRSTSCWKLWLQSLLKLHSNSIFLEVIMNLGSSNLYTGDHIAPLDVSVAAFYSGGNARIYWGLYIQRQKHATLWAIKHHGFSTWEIKLIVFPKSPSGPSPSPAQHSSIVWDSVVGPAISPAQGCQHLTATVEIPNA